MKNFLLIVFFTYFATTSSSQDLVVSNEIINTVHYIKYQNKTGSSFRISIDKKDYLVTARHLFPNSLKNKSSITIELFKDSIWVKVPCTLMLHDNNGIDIVLLDLNSTSIKENKIDINGSDFYLSQDCYFLGFPYGLKIEDKTRTINNGFPVPFVKKGIISSFFKNPQDVFVIFIDGHNNPGFSGGPVVIKKMDSKGKYDLAIIGVVSSYVNDKKMINTPFGKIINYENSGIVISYGIDHVNEIIENNKN